MKVVAALSRGLCRCFTRVLPDLAMSNAAGASLGWI